MIVYAYILCVYTYVYGPLSPQLAPPQAESILEAMHRVKNPHCMCVKLHQMISQLLAELREIAKTTPSRKS